MDLCVNLKLMGGQYLVDEDRIGIAEDGLLHLSAGRNRFDGLHDRYPSAVSQAARRGCHSHRLGWDSQLHCCARAGGMENQRHLS